jgi:hypothetical protein
MRPFDELRMKHLTYGGWRAIMPELGEESRGDVLHLPEYL